MAKIELDHTAKSHLLTGIDSLEGASALIRKRKGGGYLIPKANLAETEKLLKQKKIKYTKAASAKPKAAKTHPSYLVMISKAIQEIGAADKSRKGSSRTAIKKYILVNWKVGPRFDTMFRTQIRRLVANGNLTQTGQTFKVTEKGKKEVKIN